ncbi:hypothetical protein COOONC_28241 [Cooperia oncophora]
MANPFFATSSVSVLYRTGDGSCSGLPRKMSSSINPRCRTSSLKRGGGDGAEMVRWDGIIIGNGASRENVIRSDSATLRSFMLPRAQARVPRLQQHPQRLAISGLRRGPSDDSQRGRRILLLQLHRGPQQLYLAPKTKASSQLLVESLKRRLLSARSSFCRESLSFRIEPDRLLLCDYWMDQL